MIRNLIKGLSSSIKYQDSVFRNAILSQLNTISVKLSEEEKSLIAKQKFM